jgi:hypothetical protein
MNFLVRLVNSRTVWVFILFAAGANAIAFGIIGIERGDGGFANGQIDMRYLYAAGRCLIERLSPYDQAAFAVCSEPWTDLGVAYAYPPQTGPLGILLSRVPYWLAQFLMVGINLACVIGLAALCATPTKFKSDLGVSAPEARWLIPALILGNPFTAHVLWLGQTSLIAIATLAGGWV